ncbi:DUF2834 domain-containing protein [Aerosakkonemataceae cyanobacterium BLCC-F154]|uniref:DUF2834 domain-containing protein n=1 Tax=Floridaenema fluviatile BLCC-F154 TaxID=3153640 RepID=A0ABV4YAR7_9CYAN
MSRKIALWSLWAGFILYILLFAPPVQASTLTLLKNLFTGDWLEINPIIFSLFSLVGIWLLIYSCLMLIDGRMQKIAAWPFLLAGIATGVMGLIPYLALREANQEFSGKKDILLKLFDSRWTGLILTISTIILLIYGLTMGNWQDFIVQFKTSRFINGMSLAFCLFYLLFPTLLGDDIARRGVENKPILQLVSLIPLLGALFYLCWRPPLWESMPQISSTAINKTSVTASKT